MVAAIAFVIRPCGDSALAVEFGTVIDPVLNASVRALDRALDLERPAGLIEAVPTYRSLLIHYDPCIVGFLDLSNAIERIAASALTADRPRDAVDWMVPVLYGGEFGADLDVVASRVGMTPGELVACHSATRYLVYMIGFSPGVAYLGTVDTRLELPRRDEPRPLAPAGSVSIAGRQSAIHSLAGPSGWHLLGRTPVRTFLPHRKPMFLFNPSDTIGFYPISADQWADLDRAAAAGEPVAKRIAT